MNMNFEEMLGKVTELLHSEAQSKTVIGEQFTLGEFTCVPVVKLGLGFGSGGGEGEDSKKVKGGGGGSGGALGIAPVGFLVSRAGEISFLSTEKSKGLSQVFEKVPDLIEKFMEQQVAKKQKEEPVMG